MDSIFTLPYSEYEAIVHVQRYFKKTDGYSIFIPTSRQEKGVDFIVLNTRNKKLIRFQVKGSRPFSSTKPTKTKYMYTFWFSNFREKCNKNVADVYLLFGLYPMYDVGKNIKSKKQLWRSFVLAFTEKEMKAFLSRIKTKSQNKPDKFFYISFNDINKIVVTRGRSDMPDITSNLLSNKIKDIIKLIK